MSGARSPYDLRFSPMRDGVRTLSAHAFVTSYRKDLLEVDGEILNNRPKATFLRYATVTFYSAAGHKVAEAEAFFPQEYVRARARASFDGQIAKPRKPYSKFTVEATTQALNGYPPPPSANIVVHSPTRDPQNNLHYRGRVTNQSKKAVSLGSVEATLYNTFGNVVYVSEGTITPGTLTPRKTGAFQIVVDDPAGVNASTFTLAD